MQWTHKDSPDYPWESFGIPNGLAGCPLAGNSCAGNNSCPFCFQHGCSFNADVHLDSQVTVVSACTCLPGSQSAIGRSAVSLADQRFLALFCECAVQDLRGGECGVCLAVNGLTLIV